MPIDWDREQAFWDVMAWTEPPEDWLATVIRSALRSSVGNAEPSPAIWDRTWQNILDMDLSLSHQEEDSAMLNYKNDVLVQREHHKDLLREAEQERQIQTAELRQPGNWRLHRKAVNWIGVHMVRWGQKLQHYGTTPSPCHPRVACEH